jgi:hypothetical protein
MPKVMPNVDSENGVSMRWDGRKTWPAISLASLGSAGAAASAAPATVPAQRTRAVTTAERDLIVGSWMDVTSS